MFNFKVQITTMLSLMNLPLKRKMLPGPVLCIIILLLFGSCTSLKHNYLGSVTRRDPGITSINVIQKMGLDSARRAQHCTMDSLMQAVSTTKKRNRHLAAGEINQLYNNFGSQLNDDRLFNALLQTGGLKRKKLSFRQRYAAVKLLYAAAEYDSTYQQVNMVRRALNRGDKGNHIPRHVLQKSHKFLYSPSIRRKLASARNKTKPDVVDTLLQGLPRTNVFKSAYGNIYHHNDRLYGLLYNAFPAIGQALFGKVGNRISDRAKQKRDANLLLSVLKPYDILLSRAPGHLTAKVIPGYFGHASLWLGSEVPRKRKPIFLNILRKDTVRIGIRHKCMAEALRNGVQLSKLLEYADADEYIVIRPRSLKAAQKQSIVQNAMKQMGKGYDFNFDVESSDLINCTELVYLAYDFVDWEVRWFMNRYTLFPDDILLTALDNEELFEVAAFVKDGKLIENIHREEIKELTNTRP